MRDHQSRPVGHQGIQGRLDLTFGFRIQSRGGFIKQKNSSILQHRPSDGETLALTTPLEKGVQVLEAQDASLTPFDRVFMVHANDAVFPRTFRSPGVFSNEERADLADSGLPLERRILLMHRDAVHRSERTLWRATTQQAGVTICYRTTDFRGTPRLPSLMVPEHDPAKELARTSIPQGAETSLDEALIKGALTLVGSRDDASLLPARTPEPKRLGRAVQRRAERHAPLQEEIEGDEEEEDEYAVDYMPGRTNPLEYTTRFDDAKSWTKTQPRKAAASPQRRQRREPGVVPT